MTVLKGGEIDRFLKNPESRRAIALVYGPDSGLVSERARAIAKTTVPDLDDPFAVIRLDGDVLAGDPVRLSDEANTMALFGGKRLIWVRAGEKPIAAALTPLLADPPTGAFVLIEAGDLKKNAALRVEAERSGHAAVIPCYSDGEADLKRLIAEETAAAGLTMEPPAIAALLSFLGGDRAASRAEIQKICLYAHGQGRITLADIEALAGDSLALGVDEIVDAAASGDPAALDRLLLRAAASGVAVPQIMIAMGRHLSSLHKARTAIEKGAAISAATDRFEPPVFFRRRPVVEKQLGLWNSVRLERMMTRVAEATFETRIKTALAEAIVNRTLMAIAMTARAGRN
ncbi:MAG: DNA polymerase III subunit delta [Rhizobiales bacterium]|nr:DNA polymerase III subunit delta [Hyphomicrobiales bacterium]